MKYGLKPVLRMLNIPDRNAGLHAFRHGLATELAQSEPITVLQTQMRHADVRTTLKVYAHVIPQSQRDSMERIARRSIGTNVPIASLLGEPTRAVMFCGKLKVAPLNFVLVHILDAHVGNGNPARYNFQVIPLGNFFSERFRVATPVFGNMCEAGIKLLLHFVVKLDAQNFTAAAFDQHWHRSP